jgi:hypothetical protein
MNSGRGRRRKKKKVVEGEEDEQQQQKEKTVQSSAEQVRDDYSTPRSRRKRRVSFVVVSDSRDHKRRVYFPGNDGEVQGEGKTNAGGRPTRPMAYTLARSNSGMPLCPACKMALGSCNHTCVERLLLGSVSTPEEDENDGDGAAAAVVASDHSAKRTGKKGRQHGAEVAPGDMVMSYANVRSNPEVGGIQRACASCWCPENPLISFECEPSPHEYCLECFTSYAQGCIRERKLCLSKKQRAYTIKCPFQCSGSAVDPACFELLGKQALEAYIRFSALELAQDMEVVWCPHEDCEHGLLPPGARQRLQELDGNTQHRQRRAGVVDCPKCMRPVCLRCGEGHGARAKCGSVMEEDGLLGDGSTKKCPDCGVLIFKDGGCNHVTCVQCKGQFCWLCSTPWREGSSCQQEHWSDDPLRNIAYNAKQRVMTWKGEGAGMCVLQ